eukprot:Nk52_evm1s1905 gene=Nk52_evmTU1s1905
MKVLHTVLACKEHAQTWVENSPFRNGGGNFDVFENRFKKRFVSELLPFEYFIEAFNFQCFEGGSVAAYVDKVCSLLSKAKVTDPLTGFAAIFNGLPEDIK